MLAKAHSKRQA